MDLLLSCLLTYFCFVSVLWQQERREDCYEAKLHVREVDPTDSRTYFLRVENERGTDRHFLRLAVRGSYTHGKSSNTFISPLFVEIQGEGQSW